MAEKKKILYIVEAMGGGVFTYIVDFRQPVSYLIPAIFFSGCIVFAVSWLCERRVQ